PRHPARSETWSCRSTIGSASASRTFTAAPSPRPNRGGRRSTRCRRWCGSSMIAATTRYGSAIISPSPSQSSIRFCNWLRPPWWQLWIGEPVTYEGRHFGGFREVSMQPPARQSGGPPIWVGGRADAALARTGRLADGWISYVVTPETYRAGLATIAAAAEAAGRKIEHFGTGHLLFARLDETYDKALDAAAATLSNRYAMDFRRAAERYAALGRPEQVAARIRAFHEAGVRHLVLDLVGPYEERPQQIDGF